MIRNQTIIIGICSFIIVLLMIVNTFLPSNKETRQKVFNATKFYVILAILFIIIPIVLVHLYAVNCMLEGNCNTFVWVLVGLSVFFTLLYLVMFVIKALRHKKAEVHQETKR